MLCKRKGVANDVVLLLPHLENSCCICCSIPESSATMPRRSSLLLLTTTDCTLLLASLINQSISPLLLSNPLFEFIRLRQEVLKYLAWYPGHMLSHWWDQTTHAVCHDSHLEPWKKTVCTVHDLKERFAVRWETSYLLLARLCPNVWGFTEWRLYLCCRYSFSMQKFSVSAACYNMCAFSP